MRVKQSQLPKQWTYLPAELWKFNIDQCSWPELAARETLRLGRPPNQIWWWRLQRRPSHSGGRRVPPPPPPTRIDANITEARGCRVPAPLAAVALTRPPPPAAQGGSDIAPLSLALQ